MRTYVPVPPADAERGDVGGTTSAIVALCAEATKKPPEPEPFTPGESWLDAFSKQCTNEMREDALEYSLGQVRMIRRKVDPSVAADLVHDVILDTMAGDLAWQPQEKSLFQHTIDAVRWRARDIRKAKPYTIVPVDTYAGAKELEACLARESAPADPGATIIDRESFAQMRTLAAGTPSLLRYIDALEAGARGRDDIMTIANLSIRTYRTARARLQRIAEQLELSEAAPRRV